MPVVQQEVSAQILTVCQVSVRRFQVNRYDIDKLELVVEHCGQTDRLTVSHA